MERNSNEGSGARRADAISAPNSILAARNAEPTLGVVFVQRERYGERRLRKKMEMQGTQKLYHEHRCVRNNRADAVGADVNGDSTDDAIRHLDPRRCTLQHQADDNRREYRLHEVGLFFFPGFWIAKGEGLRYDAVSLRAVARFGLGYDYNCKQRL